MPYKATKLPSGKVKVTSPHGTKARATTKAKAEAQMRLLRGVERGWRPTGSRAEHSEPTGKKEKTGHNLMGG